MKVPLVQIDALTLIVQLAPLPSAAITLGSETCQRLDFFAEKRLSVFFSWVFFSMNILFLYFYQDKSRVSYLSIGCSTVAPA